MRDFPQWLLAMTFTSLASVLTSPFYMFGGLHVFGESHYGVINFLYYILQNLLWVLPVLLFFATLEFYRIGMKRTGISIACISLVVAALSFVLLVV